MTRLACDAINCNPDKGDYCLVIAALCFVAEFRLGCDNNKHL